MAILTKSDKDASGLHFCDYPLQVHWIGNLPPPIKDQTVALNWRPRSIKHTLEMKLISPRMTSASTRTLHNWTGVKEPVWPVRFGRTTFLASWFHNMRAPWRLLRIPVWNSCLQDVMYQIKPFSQLTCPFHVESETVTETTKQWQWSTKMLREPIQTTEKWRWKILPRFVRF